MSKHIRVTKLDHKTLSLLKLHTDKDSLGEVIHYLISYLHWGTDYADYPTTDPHHCMAMELLKTIKECEDNG